MASVNELMNHPALSFVALPDGVTEARFTVPIWGQSVIGRFWPVAEKGRDPWAYELAAINGQGGRYSHVSEHGCKIMLVKHLIASDWIETPEDNSHLDERNQEIAAESIAARETFKGKPRVGDFVRMPNGSLERCASETKHGMQTCVGGSFSVFTSGRASMSGSLNRSQLAEYFVETEDSKVGKFWFFSHGRGGAGRGVDVFMPCRVYRLVPFTMDEETARAHPKAKNAAAIWGESHPDHLRTVRELMEGRA